MFQPSRRSQRVVLSGGACRSPEEAVVHALLEARRAAPAILHLPHLQLWWETAQPSLRATLWMLLADLPPDLPLLLLASADVPLDELDAVRTPVLPPAASS